MKDVEGNLLKIGREVIFCYRNYGSVHSVKRGTIVKFNTKTVKIEHLGYGENKKVINNIHVDKLIQI